MNNINADVSRLQGVTIPVGDDPVVGSATLAAPQKILTEPSVTVNEVSFDTLVEQLNQEYVETLQNLNIQRLSQTLEAMSVRKGKIDDKQAKLLEESTKLTKEIEQLQKQLGDAKTEQKNAKDALEAAKEKKDPPATAEELKKLSDDVAAADQKVSDLSRAILKDSVALNVLVQQLDDSLKAELMAVFSAEPMDLTACLKLIHEQAKDELRDALPAIEALTRLLGGEKMNDLLMEKNGIKA